jgi:putative ABC transport system ATP-binding protein
MNIIHIQSLVFNYLNGEFRLEIPSFTVARGEKAAVIGPSGSGKTTLLNLIAGIITPVKGFLSVNQTRVNELTDSQRRAFRISNIGFVFQDFELLDYLSVMDNILHPYRITGALKLTREVRERARTLAEDMGIGGKLKRMSGDLSHGERQRTCICRAILTRPKVILADEATGNLDPKNKVRILDLLFDVVARNGSTLLAVTHDYELLKRFDRVVDFGDFGCSHA